MTISDALRQAGRDIMAGSLEEALGKVRDARLLLQFGLDVNDEIDDEAKKVLEWLRDTDDEED